LQNFLALGLAVFSQPQSAGSCFLPQVELFHTGGRTQQRNFKKYPQGSLQFGEVRRENAAGL
jgi:hypothetical protein